MNFFQRRRVLNKINTLDLIPVRILGHDVQEGRIVILAPKFNNLLIRKLFPMTREMFYRIRLDEAGSFTWNNINGTDSLSAIIDKLKGDPILKTTSTEDTEERVSKFISLLYDWEYITFRQLMESKI